MNHLLTSRPFLLGILSLLVVLPACDSGGGNEPTIQNEFSFTVTPDQSSSTSAAVPKISGERVVNGFSFWVDSSNYPDEASEDVFAVYFTGGDVFSKQEVTQGTFGILGRPQSGRPDTGTYDYIAERDAAPTSAFSGLMYENLSDTQNEPYYILRNGTVEITTSTEDEVSGSFSGSAWAITLNSSTGEVTRETVQVSGSFTAAAGDEFIPYGQYSNPPSQ